MGHEEPEPALTDTTTFYYGPAWHSLGNRLDVDDSGAVVPLDALPIINELNNRTHSAANGDLPAVPPTSGYPFPHWDTSGDNFVTALDELLVINYINTPLIPPPGPESEVAAASSAESLPLAPTVSPLILAAGADDMHDQVFAELEDMANQIAGETWLAPPTTMSFAKSETIATSSARRVSAIVFAEEVQPWSQRLKKGRRPSE